MIFSLYFLSSCVSWTSLLLSLSRCQWFGLFHFLRLKNKSTVTRVPWRFSIFHFSSIFSRLGMSWQQERLFPANYQRHSTDDRKVLHASHMYKCEGLFAEFIRKFQAGHGQMKSVGWRKTVSDVFLQVLTETNRSARPSVILSAPNVQRSDDETAEITRLAISHCLGDETLTRRRYVLVNFPKFSFLLGGYDFDIERKIRSQPAHDFLYDIVRRKPNKPHRFLSFFVSRVLELVDLFQLFLHLAGWHSVSPLPNATWWLSEDIPMIISLWPVH